MLARLFSGGMTTPGHWITSAGSRVLGHEYWVTFFERLPIMMEYLVSPEAWAAFLALVTMEIILGID
ncbi:MAG: hypothetical protein K8F25_17175, partial [Fimbriimonadaceae bacterium]|nr:hypothetical protein [Alphaproteobacteria bacterium]